jgi:hypothetical protein
MLAPDKSLAAVYLTPVTAAIVADLLPGFSPETPVSPMAAAIVTGLARRYAGTAAVVTSRNGACEITGLGMSRIIQLERAGELHSYLDGAARRITVASIYARSFRLAFEAHPVGGPPAVVRHPRGEYAKKPRPRTPAELEGLRRGNEGRRLAALARRAAKAQARAAAQAAAAP